MVEEMANLTVFAKDGSEVGQVDFDVSSLDVDKAKRIVSDVAIMYMANQKKRTACVKSRGEIDLTNRKPYKQKGTGRARAGSARSPIWVGGGVAFGPKPRNTYYRIPVKLRRKALKDAFSLKAFGKEMLVLDELTIDEVKTKSMAQLLKSLKLEGKRTLIVTDKYDSKLVLSSRNISSLKVTTVDSLNSFDLVNGGMVIVTKAAFEKLSQKFAA